MHAINGEKIPILYNPAPKGLVHGGMVTEFLKMIDGLCCLQMPGMIHFGKLCD